MLGIGMPELILILLVALLVLGPKKLPEIGRAIGKGLSEFKRAMSGLGDLDLDGNDEPPAVKKDDDTHAGAEGAPASETAIPPERSADGAEESKK